MGGILRVHRTLLATVHHMLLLWVMALLVVLGMLILHMVTHMVVPHPLRRVQRWATSWAQHPRVLGHRRRLELATRVHHGSLVAVGGTIAHHVHGGGTFWPVYLTSVHLLLLSTIVRCVPHVYPVVGGKPRVRHSLGRLTSSRRAPIVMGRNALTESYDVGVTTSVWVRLHSAATTLGHLHGCPVVLVLMGMLRGHHTTVTHVWHVRVGKIRAHRLLSLVITTRIYEADNTQFTRNNFG